MTGFAQSTAEHGRARRSTAELERVAKIACYQGLEPRQHEYLAYFAIRAGARRLADAVARPGLPECPIVTEQDVD